jgi:ribosomal protein S18 acetylase RimI-like enzyme
MYKIKAMEISDYEEIINLWKNTEGVGIHDYEDSKESINHFLTKNPRTCFVVIYNDKEIIGTIMGGNDGRRGLIYHLVVKPEHRRKGLGKKLLEKTEAVFKEEGIRKIYLLVFKKNKNGNDFWERREYSIDENVNFRSRRISE